MICVAPQHQDSSAFARLEDTTNPSGQALPAGGLFAAVCKIGQEPRDRFWYSPTCVATTLDDLLPILAELSRERGDKRSLTELAAEAGQSSSHFQRAFSRLVGESPKQYTRRLSLECGAVLLLTTEQSVLDIALEVGFDSHEGFTRAFAAHFGTPPREFRDRAIDAGLTDQVRHAELMMQIGPCLRLFRAPLSTNLTEGNDKLMNYDITQQPVAETTLLYKSARCTHDAIGATLGQLLPPVFQYAAQHGIQMMGPPTTVYVAWGPGMVTMHAGMPVAAGAQGQGDILVEVLPAGTAAVTIHVGPYDGLQEAHAAIEAYLHDNGLKSNGPSREVYLTDPGEVPDPDEWKTQIIWPVASP